MANQTVAAVFDRYEDAANAVSQLESAGISHSSVSIVSNDADQRSRYDANGSPAVAPETADGAGTGASLGTVVGGGAGLLAGLGMLAIPGLGPVVAAGWLVSTLVGAGVGAAAGGLLGSLTGAGVSEADAHTYAEAVHRGGTLVTVASSEVEHDRVVAILERAGAVDLDARSSTWRSQYWTGRYADDAAGANPAVFDSSLTTPITGSRADPDLTTPVTGSGVPSERPRARSYPQT